MHTTVLLHEAVDGLALKEDAVVIDCTYGGGGHSDLLLRQLSGTGQLISIDADETAFAGKTPAENQQFVVGNFREIGKVVREAKLPAPPAAILADLGWRTDQFEAGGKGFSFLRDEPLQMTFGNAADATFTAYDIVNEWEETSIADVIYGYGEERAARMIAAAIIRARAEAPITTSRQLATIIEDTVGHFYTRLKIHPATKTFQALRIAVNDELGALKTLLADGYELLAPGGRLAIISFHSLEDRIVKQTFRAFKDEHQAHLITKKPITPSTEELQTNSRARSAKLRILEK